MIRWTFFDLIADVLGRFLVSWACWGLSAQRNAVQRADAQWLDLTGARG